MGFLFDADPRLLRLWGITTLVFMTTVIFFGAVCTMLTPMESPAKALMARQFVSPSNAELMVNTIGFGLFALLCFVMRIFSRAWVMKAWALDDLLMCITFFFYTCEMVLINVSAHYATNLYPPDQAAGILANPEDVANRILGSKIVVPMEQCMIFTTWGVKFCIWHYFWRVNRLTNWERPLKFLFAYLWISFAVIEIFYYFVLCRPFSQYWAMPVQNIQCATYQHYSIIQMVFNISSDLWLIISPMPIIHSTRLPLKRKALLGSMFALGFVTIIAAILNKIYNFQSPLTTVYQLWYIREASTAVAVGNLICSWQLIQKLFKLRSFDDKQAEIQPLAAAPHLGGGAMSSALNKVQLSIKHKIRGVYDITEMHETVASHRASASASRTVPSEKTFNNSSMMTSVTTAVEPGTPPYGAPPHFSEDGEPNPLGSHPVHFGSPGTANRFADFVRMGRQRWAAGDPHAASSQATTTRAFTVARDGDDAGPALAYRDQHDIV